MFRRGSARSANTARAQARDDGSRHIDETIGPDDDTVHVDARTGHVSRRNPDGSVTITPLQSGKPRKPRVVKRFSDNLAEDLDENTLASIATTVLEGIEQDILSRKDWEATCQKGASLIGVTLEEPSAATGADGLIARVKHTGLLNAVITSWANSRAELLPVGGPVKVRDDSLTDDDDLIAQITDAQPGMGHNGGPPLDGINAPNVMPFPGPHVLGAGTGIAAAPQPGPSPVPGQMMPQSPGMPPAAGQAPAPPPPPISPPGQGEKRNALADALEKDMNHYLTVVDEDYYPDFSQMLISRALLGVQFRKVYHDPILRRPVSRWVKGTDLIVSNDATALSGAARITERIKMRQGTSQRLMAIGHWRNVALVIPTSDPSGMDRKIAETEGIKATQERPQDQLHTIYECYTDCNIGELTKDENGKTVKFPLPYRITLDKDSRKVVEIRRNWKEGDKLYLKRKRYVKYGHVPGLGFYDWGYVHMIGNSQRAATMLEKVLIDTGMLVSYPGGLMRKSPGTRQRSTEIRPGLGEWITVETGGLPIQDFAMPMPYKEPSAVLQSMMGDVAAQMKQVSGQIELPVGEGRIGNTPVGTIMAYIEAVSKVPSAVHKDDHIAQQQEFRLLKELFAEDPGALWKFAEKPTRQWAVAREIMDQDLVPAADPNVPSQAHRLMQTQLLVGNAGLPQFQGIANQRAIWERSCRSIGASNTGEYTMPQMPAAPPPPDPRVVAAQIKAQSQQQSDQIKSQQNAAKLAADAEKTKVESADKEADRLSEEKRAAMAESRAAIEAHAGVAQHAISTAADHAQHTDQMHAKAAELVQDHVQHLNDLTAEAQAQAGQQQHEANQQAAGQNSDLAGDNPSQS